MKLVFLTPAGWKKVETQYTVGQWSQVALHGMDIEDECQECH